MSNEKIPEKWLNEQKAIKAIQMAFDLDKHVNFTIRKEALELDLNPSDRIREILGLPVNRKPQRPRLSISLSAQDFEILAKKFDVATTDRVAIKQKAAELLVRHVNGRDSEVDSTS